MADQPAYLPPLTDLESKALELLISSDRPLRDTAKDLGISADALLDLIESPSLKPYLAVATWATQQSQFFAAAKHHRENLDNLRELASDQTADPALRLRACLTIFRGVPPAPPPTTRLDLPLRPLPPVTRTPSHATPRPQTAGAPTPSAEATPPRAQEPTTTRPIEPILNLNRKTAAHRAAILRSNDHADTPAGDASPLAPHPPRQPARADHATPAPEPLEPRGATAHPAPAQPPTDGIHAEQNRSTSPTDAARPSSARDPPQPSGAPSPRSPTTP